jgi:protein-disulfide isomerase
MIPAMYDDKTRRLFITAVVLAVFSLDALADMPGPMPPRRPQPDAASTYAIKIAGHPSEGPADAKVTLVMVQDYADPFSDRFRDQVLPDLRKKYGTDLRLVYRNFVVHRNNAMAAALASCAAHKRGKFLDMEGWLWDSFKQRQLDQTEVKDDQGVSKKCWEHSGGCAIVSGHARQIGLDSGRFRADMKACVATVEADMTDLAPFRITGTPTFFINGRVIVGSQQLGTYTTLIDEELQKANDRIKAGTPKASYYKKHVLEAGKTRVD